MLFSDESCFCVDHAIGRFHVYRRTGERYADTCVMELVDWVEQTLWYWEASHMVSQTQIVVLNFQDNGPGCGLTVRRYIDQMLRPHADPFFRSTFGVYFPAG